MRITTVCFVVVLSLAVARPALSYSLVSLEPNERENMLTTCNRLPGNDRSLCRNVVDDHKVVANYKRGCLEAMTALLKGTAINPGSGFLVISTGDFLIELWIGKTVRVV